MVDKALIIKEISNALMSGSNEKATSIIKDI